MIDADKVISDAIGNLDVALADIEGLRDALEVLAEQTPRDPCSTLRSAIITTLHVMREKIESAVLESERLELAARAGRKPGSAVAASPAPVN